MVISLIVAFDENHCIGKDNRLPWHLSSDLKRFKRLTMGHHLIMGRKTWESIGRPLPGRKMLVVSRQKDFPLPETEGTLCASLEQALEFARMQGDDEVFIIGGGEIFRQALPYSDRIYLTRVHIQVPCDTYFPPFEHLGWSLIEQNELPATENEPLASTFQILQRRETT